MNLRYRIMLPKHFIARTGLWSPRVQQIQSRLRKILRTDQYATASGKIQSILAELGSLEMCLTEKIG